MTITGKERKDLKKARKLLEKESSAIRLVNLFGDAAEDIARHFPEKWKKQMEQTCIVTLEKSWEFSVTTMSGPDIPPESETRHRTYAMVSGAIGGAGIISLFAEIPVTGLIMIRSVADIAKSEGEDFRDFETKIACLQSFALSGDIKDIHTGESGYYASRDLLEKPLDESARYIAKKGLAGIGAPFSAQLAAKLAAKYQAIISAKAAANLIPLAGAIAGLSVNIIFINYFMEKAQGHFIIRRLEKKYGKDEVRQLYKIAETGIMPKSKVSAKETEKLIRRYVYASMGAGLIPIPFLDFAGITGIQIRLLRKLAQMYEIPFSGNMLKTLVGSLIGGAFSASVGVRLGGSLAKLFPVIGQSLAVATVSLSAGASTYAVANVFNRHFSEGGTFLSFDPAGARDFYETMFGKGLDMAMELRNRN